jgi:hypothetical protein
VMDKLLYFTRIYARFTPADKVTWALEMHLAIFDKPSIWISVSLLIPKLNSEEFQWLLISLMWNVSFTFLKLSLPSWTYRMDAVLATNAVQVKQFLGNTYRC